MKFLNHINYCKFLKTDSRPEIGIPTAVFIICAHSRCMSSVKPRLFPAISFPTWQPLVVQDLLIVRDSRSPLVRQTTMGRNLLDEWSARCREFYLIRRNIHKRQTSMPSAGFEPTILTSQRPQTQVLDYRDWSFFHSHSNSLFTTCALVQRLIFWETEASFEWITCKERDGKKRKRNKESPSRHIQEMRPPSRVFLFIQTSQIMGLWKLHK